MNSTKTKISRIFGLGVAELKTELKNFMKTLYVIKIGGKVIHDEAKMDAFLDDFAGLNGMKILVHGGGNIATDIAHKLGIKVKMVEGRRITDKENLKVAMMVYAGLLNKQIVAKLYARQCMAIGLTGADMNAITARKRPIREIDYGYVGDVAEINQMAIGMFLQKNCCPVFCALTHDMQGNILNTNADTIASEIAVAMSGLYNTKLVYCFDKKGVLENPKDDESVISELSMSRYKIMRNDNSIHAGMIPKLDNSFSALIKGVGNVIICQADDLKNLNQMNFNGTNLTL